MIDLNIETKIHATFLSSTSGVSMTIVGTFSCQTIRQKSTTEALFGPIDVKRDHVIRERK